MGIVLHPPARAPERFNPFDYLLSLTEPRYLSGASAWEGHIPFAFACIGMLRPRVLVELGTHKGDSYCAFCQAVDMLRLATKCYAVDTWKGDEHAGFYDDRIYRELKAYHDPLYGSFSRLIRSTFDEALGHFPDGTVDLLHIDGLHTYEAVKHDFEAWLPKMSARGVVLFHDTNVREGGFGVGKFWTELIREYPAFEFVHGHGLGVLAVGREVPEAVLSLTSADPTTTQRVRSVFFEMDRLRTELDAHRSEVTRRDDEMKRLRAALHASRSQTAKSTDKLNTIRESTTWKVAKPALKLERWLKSRVYVRTLAIKHLLKSFVVERNHDLPIIFISGEAVDQPGYNYRIVHYAEAFERLGVRTICLTKDQIDEKFHLFECALLIYIWRAAWDRRIGKLFDYAGRRNIPIWFDLDDLIVRPEFASEDFIDAIRFDKHVPSKVAEHYKLVQKTMLRCAKGSATTRELVWHMQKVKRNFPCFVLPNGFSEETYTLSRIHARMKKGLDDGIVRIGYASGTRTHQADFRRCADALAAVLKENDAARLVLFRKNDVPTLELNEFPQFEKLTERIEWRPFVEYAELPKEIARFDVNLAPLEDGNPFCEAKSELKFFEAAIADVPTIASPTGPFGRAIEHGVTGFLAETSDEWLRALRELLHSAPLRARLGRAAHRSALWTFGPTRRARLAKLVLDQLGDARTSALAFQHYVQDQAQIAQKVAIADRNVIFDKCRNQASRVTVAIPLYNYAEHVEEALESVCSQTMKDIDLVVVDDASTDDSQPKALRWMKRHADRFNRVALLQHSENHGLSTSRNTAFDFADTLYVMALDADNLLRPECCEALYEVVQREGAAFSYPKIQTFGITARIVGDQAFHPAGFTAVNGVDAMAMISKEAWSLVGGYATHHRLGWEDYDLWCRFIGAGLHGVHAARVLAEYRVHERSMLQTSTDRELNKANLLDVLERDHEWLGLTSRPRCGYRTNAY
jgi:glycosyltransferase involved in cell wall biosynthesis